MKVSLMVLAGLLVMSSTSFAMGKKATGHTIASDAPLQCFVLYEQKILDRFSIPASEWKNGFEHRAVYPYKGVVNRYERGYLSSCGLIDRAYAVQINNKHWSSTFSLNVQEGPAADVKERTRYDVGVTRYVRPNELENGGVVTSGGTLLAGGGTGLPVDLVCTLGSQSELNQEVAKLLKQKPRTFKPSGQEKVNQCLEFQANQALTKQLIEAGSKEIDRKLRQKMEFEDPASTSETTKDHGTSETAPSHEASPANSPAAGSATGAN